MNDSIVGGLLIPCDGSLTMGVRDGCTQPLYHVRRNGWFRQDHATAPTCRATARSGARGSGNRGTWGHDHWQEELCRPDPRFWALFASCAPIGVRQPANCQLRQFADSAESGPRTRELNRIRGILRSPRCSLRVFQNRSFRRCEVHGGYRATNSLVASNATINRSLALLRRAFNLGKVASPPKVGKRAIHPDAHGE